MTSRKEETDGELYGAKTQGLSQDAERTTLQCSKHQLRHSFYKASTQWWKSYQPSWYAWGEASSQHLCVSLGFDELSELTHEDMVLPNIPQLAFLNALGHKEEPS